MVQLLNNFSTEIQDEIKTLRCQILSKIVSKGVHKILPYLKLVVTEFAKVIDGILKTKEQDRPQDIIRSLMSTCVTIHYLVDIEKNELYNDWIAFFNDKIKANKCFTDVIEQLKQIWWK